MKKKRKKKQNQTPQCSRGECMSEVCKLTLTNKRIPQAKGFLPRIGSWTENIRAYGGEQLLKGRAHC